jgi:hypothetical protein
VKRGEAVRCTVDYDLFEVNINGEQGCFIKYSEVNDKYVIRFDCNEEWAELRKGEFELVNNPGYIPKQYKNLIKHIATMKTTY